VRDIYFETFQHYRLDPLADRPLRELLDVCRREHIRLALLLTPEATVFRSWYSPAARAAIDEYLARLSGAYGVPLIDGRAWLPDDDFIDTHHPLKRGAAAFSRRLGQEVLEPLVQGRLRYGAPVAARGAGHGGAEQ
jgi:hypothetical protein